jgi:AraC-like DNA-binding protein
MRQLCRAISRVVSGVSLPGRRVVVHDIHPHLLPPGYDQREHVHSYYEAHILLAGSARYMRETPQELGPGSALLHGPHMPHTWHTGDTECLRLLVWFTVEPALPVPHDRHWPHWPDALWDIALLLREAEENGSGWETRAQARVTVLLSRLLTLAEWPERAAPREETPERTLADDIDLYFRDNLDRPIALADVAAQVGMSTRSLSRQFHEHTGMTVMERLLTFRMDRAAVLLADTDATLAEIALQVGLPDPSYFCRRFRTHFHVTPQQYRRQLRDGTGH